MVEDVSDDAAGNEGVRVGRALLKTPAACSILDSPGAGWVGSPRSA
jgi:hypothetical protein